MMTLTEEQKEFIQREYKGITSKELTNYLNNFFCTNVKTSTIINYKKKMRLKSGVDTRFKKHQKPYNYKPIGSEFKSKDGYWYIKISEPNNWIHKQIYIYESYFGKVPKNSSVLFADGNKNNFSIDNLILVSNKDKLTAKNNHLLFKNKEITKTGILVAKLMNRNYEIKNKSNEGDNNE